MSQAAKRVVQLLGLCAALSVRVLGATPAPGLQPQAVTAIPSNTVIAIRTVTAIDSRSKSAAQEVEATVDDSVVVQGVTVAPVGTPAFLRVVQVQEAGAVKGRASVTLRLVALSINGYRIELATGEAAIASVSQAGKATKSGVTGAVIGGVLGAIFGGSGGAAQGATAGAAVGVGAAVASGQRVKIPAETRLSFTLTQDAVLITRPPQPAPWARSSGDRSGHAPASR